MFLCFRKALICKVLTLVVLWSQDTYGTLRGANGATKWNATYIPSPLWDREVPVDFDLDPNNNNKSHSFGGGSIKPSIVGGQDSEMESFAMHLRWDDDLKEWKFAGCAGTLITSCHVLTSAHCVSFPRKHVTEAVYVNAWRPFQNNSDGVVTKPFHFSRIIPDLTVVHGEFQIQNNFNDVAILTLETCTSDFEVIQIASMDFEQSIPIQNGVVTRVAGFGQTSSTNTSTPDILQSVEVDYMEGSDCDRNYYPLQIQPDMYCAGFPTGGKDSCNGDSGGPSYVEDPVTRRKTQIGLVSWGISCASEGRCNCEF